MTIQLSNEEVKEAIQYYLLTVKGVDCDAESIKVTEEYCVTELNAVVKIEM